MYCYLLYMFVLLDCVLVLLVLLVDIYCVSGVICYVDWYVKWIDF